MQPSTAARLCASSLSPEMASGGVLTRPDREHRFGPRDPIEGTPWASQRPSKQEIRLRAMAGRVFGCVYIGRGCPRRARRSTECLSPSFTRHHVPHIVLSPCVCRRRLCDLPEIEE